MPADLTTAAGVIAVMGTVIALLWRLHLQADAEDRRQRDDNFLLARDAVDGVKRLAAALEERNRRDLARNRKADP